MIPVPNPPFVRSAHGVDLGAGVEDWVETELVGRVGASVAASVGVGVLLGVGVDMVDTADLAEMIESSGPSFINLCWTPSEQAFCSGSIPRLAARWAAKEATMKALGRGIGEVDPIDIEVVSIEGEPPFLQVHGSAEAIARERRVSRLALSLTHEGTFAVAFVVALGEVVDPGTHTATGVDPGAPVGSWGR
jgi:holo-[acyl-carrier protein] synthase